MKKILQINYKKITIITSVSESSVTHMMLSILQKHKKWLKHSHLADIYFSPRIFFFSKPGLRFRLISTEAKENIQASANEDHRFRSY